MGVMIVPRTSPTIIPPKTAVPRERLLAAPAPMAMTSGKTPKVPSHLINNPTYDDKKKYRYAHDYSGHVAPQQYLPDELKDAVYYKPQTHTKMEAAFAEQHAANLKIIRGKRSE